jgi:PAS domain S-box-containing protein
MYDSTLTLSAAGTILKMDVDLNEPLFERGVDYVGTSFVNLFDVSLAELLSNFVGQVFTTEKLHGISFFNGISFYQLKSIITQPGKAICIITNNTRHRKVLQELEEHNLNTLVDAHVDWVYSFDTNFTLVTANKAFLEGRLKANANRLHIGDNIFKYVHEEGYKKWLPIYERALTGEIICFEEKRDLDGLARDVEIYLTPVYNNNAEIIGCLGVTRDITERKNNQLAIEGYTNKLEEFAFRTSHDLRRPIANIMGMAGLLTNEILDEDEKAKAIRFIAQSVSELDSVVISMVYLIQQYNT